MRMQKAVGALTGPARLPHDPPPHHRTRQSAELVGGAGANGGFMNTEKLNRWLTLGANIGVVLGLIVLIVEVRQNAALTLTSMEGQLSTWQSDSEFRMATSEMAPIHLKSIFNPEDLTLEEIRRLEAMFIGIQTQMDYLLNLEDAGLVSRKRVEIHVDNNARFYFGNPYAKAWWNANAIGWEGTRLYEVAGPIVEATDPAFLETYYRDLSVLAKRLGEPGGAAARYRLADLPGETVAPGIVRQHVHGAESTVSRWEIAAGGQVPAHSHYNEQITLLLSGAAEVISGEQRISLKTGDMLVLPPHAPHAYTFTEDSTVIEFFAPRRQDWIDAAKDKEAKARQ